MEEKTSSTPIEEVLSVIRVCHLWLEATMADVSDDQAHWHPPGVANPIAAIYAHVVVGSDSALNELLLGGRPIAAAGAGSVGLSELTPGRARDWHEWALRVRMDCATFRAYSQRVYDVWYDYFEHLDESATNRVIDLSVWGMGKRTLIEFPLMQVQHFSSHTGEISALKEMQGAVGFRPGTKDGIG